METTDLIEQYAGAHRQIVEHLSGLPEEVLHFKPTADSWSVCEILIHLADSEVHGYVRGRMIIAEPGSTIMEYDQDRWSTALFYREMDHQGALKLFGILRENMAATLRKIDEEVWHHYVMHPRSGKITLLDWIQLYIDHVDIHLHQINRNLYDFQKQA